jgi:pimeloyl-[acyl-carrier protein] methyl ester esterase
VSGRTGGLYTRTLGYGPEVVLIHGWGMHSGVWEDFAERLASRLRVTLVDLPGHGRSALAGDFSLQGVADALLDAAPPRAHWLGWSLGALFVLSIASRCPERVASLMLMAGSARFVAEPGWPGVDAIALDRFADDLESDYSAAIRRFLALQTLGMENARAVSKQLDARLMEWRTPERAALRGGLALLKHIDLRDAVPHLACPSMFIFGARDRLAPKALGPAMQALSRRGEMHILDSAGHLPFLTHLEETVSLVTDFVSRHGGQ